MESYTRDIEEREEPHIPAALSQPASVRSASTSLPAASVLLRNVEPHRFRGGGAGRGAALDGEGCGALVEADAPRAHLQVRRHLLEDLLLGDLRGAGGGGGAGGSSNTSVW